MKPALPVAVAIGGLVFRKLRRQRQCKAQEKEAAEVILQVSLHRLQLASQSLAYNLHTYSLPPSQILVPDLGRPPCQMVAEEKSLHAKTPCCVLPQAAAGAGQCWTACRIVSDATCSMTSILLFTA